MRAEAATWWRQAQDELQAAHEQGSRHYLAAWLAQQGAEKGLKALYIEQHGTLAPRTHNLEYLGEQVAAPADVAADLTALNPAFDEVRYPDPATNVAPVDDITQAEAAAYLEAAERIMAWIAAQLPS
jgi:HEPN domain-containing protein